MEKDRPLLKSVHYFFSPEGKNKQTLLSSTDMVVFSIGFAGPHLAKWGAPSKHFHLGPPIHRMANNTNISNKNDKILQLWLVILSIFIIFTIDRKHANWSDLNFKYISSVNKSIGNTNSIPSTLSVNRYGCYELDSPLDGDNKLYHGIPFSTSASSINRTYGPKWIPLRKRGARRTVRVLCRRPWRFVMKFFFYEIN